WIVLFAYLHAQLPFKMGSQDLRSPLCLIRRYGAEPPLARVLQVRSYVLSITRPRIERRAERDPFTCALVMAPRSAARFSELTKSRSSRSPWPWSRSGRT